MLSDEERKAIKEVKHFNQLTRYWQEEEYEEKEIAGYIGIVLNLIEKQSKEIEELKTQIDEHVYYDLGGRSCGKTELLRHYKKGYDMNNKFWKDKIKAKIEEYEKALNIILQKDEWIEPGDTIIRNKFIHYIEFGQSLLEKE